MVKYIISDVSWYKSESSGKYVVSGTVTNGVKTIPCQILTIVGGTPSNIPEDDAFKLSLSSAREAFISDFKNKLNLEKLMTSIAGEVERD